MKKKDKELVDIIFDKGMNARSYRSKLEQFTLVGATTRAGLLSAPLRERFGIFSSLDFYSEMETHFIEVPVTKPTFF